MRTILYSSIWLLCICCLPLQAQTLKSFELNEQLMSVSSLDRWELMDIVPLSFKTYHTQGMQKIGDTFYLTAVRVTRPPKYKGKGRNRTVQDEGAGIGYLSILTRKVTLSNKLNWEKERHSTPVVWIMMGNTFGFLSQNITLIANPLLSE